MLIAPLTVVVNTALDKMFLQPIRGCKVVIASPAQPMLVGVHLMEIEAEARCEVLVTALAICVLFGTINEMRRECFVALEVHIAGVAYVMSSRVCSVLI